MKPVILAAISVLFLAGCAVFVVGCGEQKTEEEKHIEEQATVRERAQEPQVKASSPLRVVVTGSVSFDSGTELYTYSYDVENESNSSGTVDVFGIYPVVLEPVSVNSPDHWGPFYGYAEESASVLWRITDPGDPPPGFVFEGNNTYPSQHGIEPSETLSGFSFTTPVGPDNLNFTVQRWEEIPDMGNESFDPFFTLGVTGTVVGPDRSAKNLILKSSKEVVLTGGTLRVEVLGSVSFDSETQLYTYTYTVENKQNSFGTVKTFGILPITLEPVLSTGPDHWSGEYGYSREDPTGFVWTITDPGPPPPGWVDMEYNTYASEYGADPNETLTGFSITTPVMPDNVNYTVQVWWDQPPVGAGEAYDDSPPFFSSGATGTIVGPAPIQ